MSNLLKGSLNYFLIVIVFPFLLLFMTYYGFESSYVKIKHLEQPPDFIFSSVYAYRIIPNYVSVEMNNFLHFVVENYLVIIKPVLIKNGSIYYHSIFLTNALFFTIYFIILERIINVVCEGSGFKSQKNLLLFIVAVFVTCMTQYVPTNGDSIALAFFLLGVFFSLKFKKSKNFLYVILTAIVIFVSTFVRETACLNISFFAAFLVDFKNLKTLNKNVVVNVLILVLAFIIPYVLLRTMIIKQETTFFEGVYLKQNFTSPFNLLGLLYGIVGIWLLNKFIDIKERKSIFLNFLIFSMPYFAMVVLVGLFWETRLFLPIMIIAIIFARTSKSELKEAL
ncbi:hypothetical protein [Soonwooa sp.]|uniref:hypothetical protein n=1 Tax=Soonwooa sp. TaxID=1938592 RepID=UPI0035B44685